MKTNVCALFRLLLLAAMVSLCGCPKGSYASQYAVISAGAMGCASDDIAITNETTAWNTASWTATCWGKEFQCSGGQGLGVTCSPVGGKPAPSQPEPPPPPKARASAPWLRAKIAACGVSAEFPRAPNKESEEATPVGKVKTLGVELPNDQGALALSCSALPVPANVPARVIVAARDGALRNIGATLLREQEVPGGRDVLFEVRGERGLARFLLVGRTLVSAIVVPLRTVGGDAAHRFLDSVHMDPLE